MRRNRRNGNIEVSAEAKKFNFDGTLTMSFKGLKIKSTGSLDAETGVNVHAGSTMLEAGSLNIELDANLDIKGVMNLVANAKNFLDTGKINIGSSDSPYTEDNAATCHISGTDIHYVEGHSSADNIIKGADSKVTYRDIDSSTTEFSAEEFEIAGAAKEVADAICNLIAEFEDQQCSDNSRKDSAEVAHE